MFNAKPRAYTYKYALTQRREHLSSHNIKDTRICFPILEPNSMVENLRKVQRMLARTTQTLNLSIGRVSVLRYLTIVYLCA